MRVDDVNATLARNIQAAIDSRGLNPAVLSRMAGVNPTGVYDILSGKSRSPKIETVAKIAEALGMPIAFLFEPEQDRLRRNELLEAASRLSEEDQKRLLDAARAWTREAP